MNEIELLRLYQEQLAAQVNRGGILSLWSRSSRSHFSGMEDALSLNGDVRTTMFMGRGTLGW